MNSLSRQTTEHLIQSLQAGEIDNTEAAKRIAQLHTANTENYTQTLITGIIIAGLSWAVTGGSIIIPAAIAFLTWESYSNQRRDRLDAFKHISQGRILDYLPDEEREFFEPLLTENLTEQELQNPQGQDAPRSEAETQTQKGIHPQLQNIECGDVAAVIAHTLKPLILTARPRVGKGILTAQAIAQAKQQHGVSVWVIQPKPAPGELGYWKQADRFLGFYLEDYEIDDPAIAEQLTTFFKEWRASPHRPTILIIDELVKIKAMQPTWYKKFLLPQCVVEGSSGETDHRFLWLITVSPLVGDLGMSGGNRSVFDIMTLQTVVTRDHRESFKKSVASLEALPSDEQFKISPVGTLVFHSAIGLWAAVPSYPVPQILPSDRLCPEIARLFQSVSTRETISESNLSAETVSESISNRETSISQDLQTSLASPEIISFQSISDHEPMPNRARVCLELKQKGWTQTDIIELIWGVKAGGSEGYKKAIAEYRAIASEYNL